MRRDTLVPGCVRDALPHTVRYSTPHGSVRFVLWHDFDEPLTGQVVAAELAAAQGRVDKLIWKVYAHDRPSQGLETVLLGQGFLCEARAQLYVASAADVAQRLADHPSPFDTRELLQPDELNAYLDIWQHVWPDADNSMYVRDYQRLLRDAVAGIRFWAAFDTAHAVAAGYLISPPAAPFALLCGGACLPGYRRRGAYSALLRARAQAAVQQGARCLAIEASTDSAAVVGRLGFEPLAAVTFYEKALHAAQADGAA